MLPIVTSGTSRRPKYFAFRPGEPGIQCHWAMMDYGFTDNALLVAKDITQEDHDALILNADVFLFPDDLDGPVDQDIQEFFEAVHLPTDWLTPSTSWRELLRQVAGMMKFNQRYAVIAAEATGGFHSIFDSVGLDDRLRQMTVEEQAWFLATVAWYGYPPELVDVNAKLRQLVKFAGTFWDGQPFSLGGMVF